MAELDCLLIHVPKHEHMSISLGTCTSINLMPMGLLALAARLEADGLRAHVIHLGVEAAASKGTFDLRQALRRMPAPVVGLTLHWHQQAYDAIATARLVKEACPSAKVLLGGITASLFADEILAQHPEIDAVLCGDAWCSIGPVVRSLIESGTAPHVTRRDAAGNVVQGQDRPRLICAELEQMDLFDLQLLRNWPVYLQMPWFWIADAPARSNLATRLRLPLLMGLGCPHACAYCGGCRQMQETVFGRAGCMYRSPESVLGSVRQAARYGVSGFHLCFTPAGSADDAYYLEVFRRVREARLPLEVTFECWHLPTKEFVDAFAATFLPSSVITISPETAIESLRHRSKCFMYGNDALEQAVQYIRHKGLGCSLFFTAGLPSETREDIAATGVWQRKLLARFPGISVVSMPIELEPGSPLHRSPERFGVNLGRRGFADYYRAHASPQASLGYNTADMSEADILAEGARHLVGFAFA